MNRLRLCQRLPLRFPLAVAFALLMAAVAGLIISVRAPDSRYLLRHPAEPNTAIEVTVPGSWQCEWDGEFLAVRPRTAVGLPAWANRYLFHVSNSDLTDSEISLRWVHRPPGTDLDWTELQDKQYYFDIFGATQVAVRRSQCPIGRTIDVMVRGLPDGEPHAEMRCLNVFVPAQSGRSPSRVDVNCLPSRRLRREAFEEMGDLVSRLKLVPVSESAARR